MCVVVLERHEKLLEIKYSIFSALSIFASIQPMASSFLRVLCKDVPQMLWYKLYVCKLVFKF